MEWFSENPAIATISASGVVTGVAAGVTDVHAKVEGVKSNVVPLTVGSARVATFMSAGGYNTSGMATLELQGEDVILNLSENFMTSFALGTFCVPGQFHQWRYGEKQRPRDCANYNQWRQGI
ncbi:MAG: hypothetical protein HC859_14990 [Bacteroidia bacterium]|nr:hypothetical protein [Bacteroidia bacterium]